PTLRARQHFHHFLPSVSQKHSPMPTRYCKWVTVSGVSGGCSTDLSDTQKKVVALDYGMRDGKVSVRVRKALLYYTLKRLGLDADATTRKPADQQIVLLNREAADDPSQ
ncbi:hypothetical protein QZL92_14510, partial [Burkholderia dolosa]|nr:hypothetical protein [Burkholderia dolosa]